ncbi:hypothetical protein XACN24_13680 [Xanthomonas albilineans]|uniref:hypothetical protein n=1 Tax=Xanthomonas albilineans TaxID=29447 RepID=UPI0012D39657|nr:hypothetical protein [Xanthomonas albilineans]
MDDRSVLIFECGARRATSCSTPSRHLRLLGLQLLLLRLGCGVLDYLGVIEFPHLLHRLLHAQARLNEIENGGTNRKSRIDIQNQLVTIAIAEDVAEIARPANTILLTRSSGLNEQCRRDAFRKRTLQDERQHVRWIARVGERHGDLRGHRVRRRLRGDGALIDCVDTNTPETTTIIAMLAPHATFIHRTNCKTTHGQCNLAIR